MKRIILGTAGHIDHGKTTFIRALTGIDCDRLKEEKERGITIELGYANLTLPGDIKIGIVDVPGHEKFVSKMVAGASGIDVVAFIIAADEGVMPQTREHLYICELLGVKRGIIVVTKRDLVDEELLQLQIEDIKNFVKGSFLENAPVIAVSSVHGEGINDFVDALTVISKEIYEKPLDRPFRLPIDDILIIKGFGTVVRGTVISGSISVKEDIQILPAGIKSRIRSMQSHGNQIEKGYAGERVAVNLPEIERTEVERGMMLVKEGYFKATDKLAAFIHYLPYNQKPLKARFISQFHIYTRKVEGELFLINKEHLNPGEKAFVLIRLKKPVVAAYGDPFIIRGFGIYTTLGGGKVLIPNLKQIDRKIDEGLLDNLLNSDNKILAEIFIREEKTAGISCRQLSAVLNIAEEELKQIIENLKKAGIVYEDEKGRCYHTNTIKELKNSILLAVKDFHNKFPMKIGIGKRELFEKSGVGEGLFDLVISQLLKEHDIEIMEDIVKIKTADSAGHETNELTHKIGSLFLKWGLQPEENVSEISKILNEKENTVKDAINSMVRKGILIRIKEGYFIHHKYLESVKSAIIKHFSKKDLLTPQDMRDIFNISRKYIIPLLEYLDSIKFTIRVQDGRKLRGR